MLSSRSIFSLSRITITERPSCIGKLFLTHQVLPSIRSDRIFWASGSGGEVNDGAGIFLVKRAI